MSSALPAGFNFPHKLPPFPIVCPAQIVLHLPFSNLLDLQLTGSTSTTQTICSAGSYCPQGSASPITCPAGTYVAAPGQSSLFKCSLSPAGRWSSAGMSASLDCLSGYWCPEGSTSSTFGGLCSPSYWFTFFLCFFPLFFVWVCRPNPSIVHQCFHAYCIPPSAFTHMSLTL
jgi:hypothetical protein